MKGWMIRLSGLLAGVFILTAIASIAAEHLSKRRIDDEVDTLLAASVPLPTDPITESDLASLPDPVQRWLRWAGIVGQPRASTVRLEQTGSFRMQPDADWMPFKAVQHYTVDPPGFLWSVEMQMFPLITITGRDRYQDGEGSIEMRLLSLVPVASKTGGDLDQGAALRYLNEIMWFPTAALSEAIAWTPLDDSSAIATMTYAGTTVSATFVFDEAGRIVTMTADRFNDDRGEILPWSTPIDGYGVFSGIQVPTRGTGVWDYPDGPFSYIDLEIIDIEYVPAPVTG